MKNIVFVSLIGIIFFLQSCSKDDDPAPQETILYQTNFDQEDDVWWVVSTGDASTSYNDGQYWLTSLSPNYSAYYIVGNDFFANATGTVEASIKVEYLHNQTDYGNGGLAWNYKSNGSNDSYIAFGISANGFWKLARHSSTNGWVDIVSWSLNSNILQNDFNKLRIEQDSDKIHFYINGVQVYSMNYSEDLTLDKTGLYVSALSRIKADYFKAVELK